MEKIKTENATLDSAIGIIYVGWLTTNGTKKTASCLVVELKVKDQPNRAIREGLVIEISACQRDCELYDRGCKLKPTRVKPSKQIPPTTAIDEHDKQRPGLGSRLRDYN